LSRSIAHLAELAEATHDATFRPRWQSAVVACLDAGEPLETILDVIGRGFRNSVEFVAVARAATRPPAPPAEPVEPKSRRSKETVKNPPRAPQDAAERERQRKATEGTMLPPVKPAVGNRAEKVHERNAAWAKKRKPRPKS
jgi:hypothetical protein